MMKVSFSRLKASFDRNPSKGYQNCKGGMEAHAQRAQSMNNVNACNHANLHDGVLPCPLKCGACTTPRLYSKSTSNRSINTLFRAKERDDCKASGRRQTLQSQRSFLNAVRFKISKRFKQPGCTAVSNAHTEEPVEHSWLPPDCDPPSKGLSEADRSHKTRSPALNSVHPADSVAQARSSVHPSSGPPLPPVPLKRGSLYRSHRREPVDGSSAAISPPQRAERASSPPPLEWSLAQELRSLAVFGWYWGPISKLEAEERLSGLPDGAFLVRDSSDDRYVLSLSFRSCGSTRHTRIEHANSEFSFYAAASEPSDSCASIGELIERAMQRSRAEVFCYTRDVPGQERETRTLPVRLTQPVSRRTQVPSLQALCRFVIRQRVRLDLVEKLPLPDTVKAFVEKNVF